MGELLDRCAEAAHDAWLAEKVKRLEAVTHGGTTGRISWPSETGEEQLLPWSQLSEPVREFDRIVVAAIIGVLLDEEAL